MTMPEGANSMKGVGLYDQVKSAFQDIIAPELHAIRGDIHAIRGDIHRLDQKIDGVDGRLTTKIDSLRTEMGSMKGELVVEIRRVDAWIDGMERELRTHRHPGASRRPRSSS